LGISPASDFFIQPLKMDLTEGSETSEKLNLTSGKYPKENIQVSEHGENLKSRHTNLQFFAATNLRCIQKQNTQEK
jgi:hypothetical protein